mmetsp:Transcript_96928/g.167184  ORF Transcript_96928/g.167184 Transcript_96928/m.167184 type:complete len:712 (+) Transcript_96928:981-3116(+)
MHMPGLHRMDQGPHLAGRGLLMLVPVVGLQDVEARGHFRRPQATVLRHPPPQLQRRSGQKVAESEALPLLELQVLPGHAVPTLPLQLVQLFQHGIESQGEGLGLRGLSSLLSLLGLLGLGCGRHCLLVPPEQGLHWALGVNHLATHQVGGGCVLRHDQECGSENFGGGHRLALEDLTVDEILCRVGLEDGGLVAVLLEALGDPVGGLLHHRPPLWTVVGVLDRNGIRGPFNCVLAMERLEGPPHVLVGVEDDCGGGLGLVALGHLGPQHEAMLVEEVGDGGAGGAGRDTGHGQLRGCALGGLELAAGCCLLQLGCLLLFGLLLGLLLGLALLLLSLPALGLLLVSERLPLLPGGDQASIEATSELHQFVILLGGGPGLVHSDPIHAQVGAGIHGVEDFAVLQRVLPLLTKELLELLLLGGGGVQLGWLRQRGLVGDGVVVVVDQQLLLNSLAIQRAGGGDGDASLGEALFHEGNHSVRHGVRLDEDEGGVLGQGGWPGDASDFLSLLQAVLGVQVLQQIEEGAFLALKFHLRVLGPVLDHEGVDAGASQGLGKLILVQLGPNPVHPLCHGFERRRTGMHTIVSDVGLRLQTQVFPLLIDLTTERARLSTSGVGSSQDLATEVGPRQLGGVPLHQHVGDGRICLGILLPHGHVEAVDDIDWLHLPYSRCWHVNGTWSQCSQIDGEVSCREGRQTSEVGGRKGCTIQGAVARG